MTTIQTADRAPELNTATRLAFERTYVFDYTRDGAPRGIALHAGAALG